MHVTVQQISNTLSIQNNENSICPVIQLILINELYIDDKFINQMLTQKLFHSSKKELEPKQPYQKPVYKSYKELLHLDRPKRQIVYESSSEDEDFLQKLLNQQKQSKKKKKKAVKSGKRKVDIVGQQSKGGQFKVLRNTQSRQRSAQKRNNNQLSLIQQQKNTDNKLQPMPVKFNQQSQSLYKYEASPQRKQSIYIDNNSVEPMPMLYTTNNHLFQTTLNEKKYTPSALLLSQRTKFLSFSQPKQSLDTFVHGGRIQHKLDRLLEQKFQFKPTIDPITCNWRVNLHFQPKNIVPKREFIDRKTLFKNRQQEQRFVQSLRQLSRKKY